MAISLFCQVSTPRQLASAWEWAAAEGSGGVVSCRVWRFHTGVAKPHVSECGRGVVGEPLLVEHFVSEWL